ncbi:MAG: hypothetical protein JEZ11_04855 [Desulfobacterales bacterium]|nr:hypothetical protein [Desulfobacterales bacterium]
MAKIKKAPLLALSVAEVHQVLTGDGAIQIHEDDPVLGNFIVPHQQAWGRADLMLDISMQWPDGKEFQRYEKVFDSHGAWSLWRHEKNRLLQLHPPGAPWPVWQLLTDETFGSGTLFLGDGRIIGQDGRIELTNPLRYPLDQVLLMHHLVLRGGLLVHGAGVRWDRAGYLFPGVSGAGKSTLSRLLGAAGHQVLSDDRMMIRKMGPTFKAFGTPWPGDAGMAVNGGGPLAGMFFLKRGDRDRIVSIDPGTALKRLMPVTSIPWYDPLLFGPALEICDDLVSSVPAFDLFFRPTSGIVHVLEAFQRTH